MQPVNIHTRMPAFDEFLKLHNARKSKDHYRLGQRFCFMYVKVRYNELFWAPFDDAKLRIKVWLDENNHRDSLPTITDAEKRIQALREKFGKSPVKGKNHVSDQ